MSLSNDPNTISSTSIVTNDYLIMESPKFNGVAPGSIIAVEQTPQTVQYYNAVYDSAGGNTIELTVHTSPDLFLDRGLYIKTRIPLTLTKETAVTGTDLTNLEKAEGFRDICMSQYGYLSCINQVDLSLNGMQVTNQANVGEYFHAISQYYSDSTIDEQLPCSSRDFLNSADLYTDGMKSSIRSLSQDSTIIEIENKPLQASNPYETMFGKEYNSRRPFFEINKVSPDGKTFDCMVSVWTFIPFSILSISTPEGQSLYGVSELNLKITLYNDWVHRLFKVRKQRVGTAPNFTYPYAWSDIAYRHTPGAGNVELMLKQFSAGDSAKLTYKNSKTGLINPYKMGITRLQRQAPQRTGLIPALGTGDARSGQLRLASVPKSCYLFAIPRFEGVDREAFKNISAMARFRSLDVTINNASTMINGVLPLYNIGKENGLNLPLEAALHTMGYCLKLDFTKDLSCESLIIGDQSIFNIDISATIENLLDREIAYDLHTVFIYESQLEYTPTNGFAVINNIVLPGNGFTLQNILHSGILGMQRSMTMIGGGFLSSAFNVLKNAGRYLINNPGKVANFVTNAVKTLSGGSAPNVIGGAQLTTTQRLGAGTSESLYHK